MLKKIWHKLETTVAGGAIIIAAASVIAKIVGLIRDRLLFSTFGAGDITDVYWAAFKIPDLIFNILVLGALSAAFIPVFIEYWQKEKDKPFFENEAWKIANSMINIITLVLLGLGVLAFIFATPLVSKIVAPGFSPEKQAQTVSLTRIMLIAIIFFGISNVIGGILNSFRRFVAYSIAPIMYNLGIILGIVVFYKIWGIQGLAWGVVIGALFHLLIQVPSLFKTGYRYQWIWHWQNLGVKKIGKLILPRTLGLAISQINFLIITVIASTLASGSVSIFNAAFNLQSFPISVFGVSLAIAAFPVMSEAFAEKDTNKFVVQFSVTIRRVLFLIIPTSVLILLLRAQIVRVILGAGQFSWEATYLTAQALGLFSLSLFAQSLIHTLARSFYAHQNTKTPVKISLVALIINIIGSIVLTRYFHLGVMGLALSFTISSLVNMILLVIILRLKFGDLDDRKIIVSTFKIVILSALTGLVVWTMLRLVAMGVNMHTFVGVFLQGIVSGLTGIIFYLVVAVLFKFDEVKIISNWIRRTKSQIVNNNSNNKEI